MKTFQKVFLALRTAEESIKGKGKMIRTLILAFLLGVTPLSEGPFPDSPKKHDYGPENSNVTYVRNKYGEYSFDTGEPVINYAMTVNEPWPHFLA